MSVGIIKQAFRPLALEYDRQMAVHPALFGFQVGATEREMRERDEREWGWRERPRERSFSGGEKDALQKMQANISHVQTILCPPPLPARSLSLPQVRWRGLPRDEARFVHPMFAGSLVAAQKPISKVRRALFTTPV